MALCTTPKPFISAANTCRVQVYHDTPGGKAMNVLYFRKGTPWDEGDLTSFEGVFSNSWQDNISPLQSQEVEVTRIIMTDVHNEVGAQTDGHPSVSLIGERASQIMPGNVTVATKFGTGLAGRSYRGRTFHIGLTDDQCTQDSLVALMADTIRDAWIQVIADCNAGTPSAELVVVSYCQDKNWLADAVVNTVTTVTTDDTLDSMRTRLAGRGM